MGVLAIVLLLSALVGGELSHGGLGGCTGRAGTRPQWVLCIVPACMGAMGK